MIVDKSHFASWAVCTDLKIIYVIGFFAKRTTFNTVKNTNLALVADEVAHRSAFAQILLRSIHVHELDTANSFVIRKSSNTNTSLIEITRADIGDDLDAAFGKIDWERRRKAEGDLLAFMLACCTNPDPTAGAFLEIAPPKSMVPIVRDMECAR